MGTQFHRYWREPKPLGRHAQDVLAALMGPAKGELRRLDGHDDFWTYEGCPPGRDGLPSWHTRSITIYNLVRRGDVIVVEERPATRSRLAAPMRVRRIHYFLMDEARAASAEFL